MSKHSMKLRVRYAETDKMGVVYYSNYLVWFEVARTEFFREKGIVYRDIEEKDKIYLPVTEAYCRYRSPLRYDDEVEILTEVTYIGPTRITFEFEVMSGGKVTTTGKTVHVFVNEKGSPIRVPDAIKKSMQ